MCIGIEFSNCINMLLFWYNSYDTFKGWQNVKDRTYKNHSKFNISIKKLTNPSHNFVGVDVRWAYMNKRISYLCAVLDYENNLLLTVNNAIHNL